MFLMRIQNSLHLLKEARSHFRVRIQQEKVGSGIAKCFEAPVAGLYETTITLTTDVPDLKRAGFDILARCPYAVAGSSVIQHVHGTVRRRMLGEALEATRKQIGSPKGRNQYADAVRAAVRMLLIFAAGKR
jgi:hypothetical protein